MQLRGGSRNGVQNASSSAQIQSTGPLGEVPDVPNRRLDMVPKDQALAGSRQPWAELKPCLVQKGDMRFENTAAHRAFTLMPPSQGTHRGGCEGGCWCPMSLGGASSTRKAPGAFLQCSSFILLFHLSLLQTWELGWGERVGGGVWLFQRPGPFMYVHMGKHMKSFLFVPPEVWLPSQCLGLSPRLGFSGMGRAGRGPIVSRCW